MPLPDARNSHEQEDNYLGGVGSPGARSYSHRSERGDDGGVPATVDPLEAEMNQAINAKLGGGYKNVFNPDDHIAVATAAVPTGAAAPAGLSGAPGASSAPAPAHAHEHE